MYNFLALNIRNNYRYLYFDSLIRYGNMIFLHILNFIHSYVETFTGTQLCDDGFRLQCYVKTWRHFCRPVHLLLQFLSVTTYRMSRDWRNRKERERERKRINNCSYKSMANTNKSNLIVTNNYKVISNSDKRFWCLTLYWLWEPV